MKKKIYRITYLLNNGMNEAEEQVAVEDFGDAYLYAMRRLGNNWSIAGTLEYIEAIDHVGEVEVPE